MEIDVQGMSSPPKQSKEMLTNRKHIKPQYSQTVLFPNVYNNPAHTPAGARMSPAQLQANFDAFYEDFFM